MAIQPDNLQSTTKGRKLGKIAVHTTTASILMLGGTLALLPSTASATDGSQDGHNSSMKVTEGNGFPTDAMNGLLGFQAEGRIGDSNQNNPNRTWELGVGTDTQDPSMFNQANYDWTPGSDEPTDFTVEYDGNGQATLTTGDGATATYDVGDVSEGDDLYIVGVNRVEDGATNLTNLMVDDKSLESGDASDGGEIKLDNSEVGHIKVDNAQLADGFAVSGTAEFTSETAQGSEQALQVQVREDQTDGDNNGGGDEDGDENNDGDNQDGDNNQDGGDDITDETEAPLVKLTSPEDNATVNGTVDVKATVRDDDPDHYFLRIDNANGDRVFSQTYDQAETLKNELIHQFNTDEVEDGEYDIFLSARDAAGNKDGDFETDGESTDRISVTVDNSGQNGGGNGDDNGGNNGDDGNGNGGNDGDNGGNGNGDQNGGNTGNQPNNRFSQFFINIRGNVENFFLNVYNFFGFRS